MTTESSGLTGQRILILKEGSSRRTGKDVQLANISAAKVVADVVKATLGPRGMDKMLVGPMGDVTISNDGHEILKEIDVQHPAAKMIVEVSKTQDDEVGDGTTTAVILTGELLKSAGDLLDKGIHPTTIVSGYRKAAEETLRVLRELAVPIDLNDREELKKIALTSMRGKVIGGSRDHFSKIAIDAVMQVAEKKDGKMSADIDDIQIVKKTGKSLLDTQLIQGIIVDKEMVHPDMPKTVENARIALLDSALEIEKTEIDAEVRIKNPLQMKAFLDEESTMLKEMVDKVVKTKANVVLCQKGIDDMAQYFLAKAGISAVRRIKASDMEKLAKATSGRIATTLSDLTTKDLGFAKLVEERKIGEDKMVFVEGCKNPKAVSILIRAGMERLVDEAERSLHDALFVVADIVKDNKIVAGGGAIEEVLSRRLHKYAAKVGGREQLAIERFADSLEVIPTTLAENSGLNVIDTLVAIRSAHEKTDGVWMGLNAFTGKVADMMKEGVIEPLSVKVQAIKSAVEAASMILRIDDVIASAKSPPMPPQGGGMPGGMPGY
ncbi:TCP-1/cpn60 chaperonin family protein [Candidatus Bathyarchaeota archaeon]|nr:TCP-1/cpn60 chaperonin family protein [Candidatus Bathyarchaeota archaeon]